MRVERNGQEVKLVLTARETHLLMRALERASFIDTPVTEQSEIQGFCARALEVLGAPAP